jgi:hypothetical protein
MRTDPHLEIFIILDFLQGYHTFSSWQVGDLVMEVSGRVGQSTLTLQHMATFIFPTNGNALTAIKSSVLDPDPSLPPPRKAKKIEALSSVHTLRDPDRKRTFRIVTNTSN